MIPDQPEIHDPSGSDAFVKLSDYDSIAAQLKEERALRKSQEDLFFEATSALTEARSRVEALSRYVGHLISVADEIFPMLDVEKNPNGLSEFGRYAVIRTRAQELAQLSQPPSPKPQEPTKPV